MQNAKKIFDIHQFVCILSASYKNWKAPVITFFSNKGATPFQILISTILSLRTKDEVTAAAANRLFKIAQTPDVMVNLDEEKLKKIIFPVGFYATKAIRIIEICRILIDQYDKTVPSQLDELLKLPGVGRKTANLVLTEGFKKDAICVDTHVHRISNRIGYVQTKTPEKTEFALRKKLPRKYWIKYNEILVAFGQVLCRPISPFCSTCPVGSMCPRKGVKKFR